MQAMAEPARGGDVVVIGNRCVLIGMGERARPAAIERRAARPFGARVIAVPVPERRSSMGVRPRAAGRAAFRDRQRPLRGRARAVRRLQQHAPDRARRRRRLRAQRRHQARLCHAGIEVVTIPAPELGRGRGGPRGMSCLIERDPL
jgi:arginine deiminase